nr:NB-ARC domains-containing protein [Tanacetum cinerariifolium]
LDDINLRLQALENKKEKLGLMVKNGNLEMEHDSDDWESLVAPFIACAPGSKIILTTRKTKLLRELGCGKLGHLQSLSHDDAVSLFAQHALGANNFDSHTRLKAHGEGIVRKCNGLPLALIALGRLLRGKEESSVLKIDENGPGSGYFGACLVTRDEWSLSRFVSDGYYEPDVDVHLFGTIIDLPFGNVGVTNLVPYDVLEGEDVDVINADGFESDLVMMMKQVITGGEGTGPTGPNHGVEAGPSGLSGPSARSKKKEYRVNPEIPIKVVQDQLQRDLEVQTSMSKAFRAKAKAERDIRGDHLLLKNTKKRQNRIKTGQKQEAWRSREKSEAVTVDRGRKTEENAKKRAGNANKCKTDGQSKRIIQTLKDMLRAQQLSRVNSTFHVSNLKKRLSDETLAIPLDETQIDVKLHFIKEPVEIMDHEVKSLKQSYIPIINVHWNSSIGISANHPSDGLKLETVSSLAQRSSKRRLRESFKSRAVFKLPVIAKRATQIVHSTFHVSNLKKCLSNETLAIPLDEIQIDDKLYFIEEPIKIIDHEVKRLKQSRIPIVKVRVKGPKSRVLKRLLNPF